MINKFEGKYYFLSNFSQSTIVYEGITYPTVEHAFQAAKSKSNLVRQEIAGAPTPSRAKHLGRSVRLRSDWEDVKYQVMENCLRAKFAIPELKEMLLATGDEELIEGTWWHDQCWGVCYCDQHKGEGQNHLGKLLMKIREELK